MSRQTYSGALKRIAQQNGRLGLDELDLARLGPHLPRASSLHSLLVDGTAVALPSLWVRGAFWRIQLTQEHRLQVDACRTADSYKGEAARRAPTPEPTPPYVPEALDYADRNWSNLLRNDLSLSAARFTLCDPGTIGLSLVAQHCSAVFSEDILQFDSGDTEAYVKLLDRFMLKATEEPTKQEEWLGDGTTQFYHCLRCGRTLLPTHCSGCNVSYAEQQFPETVVPMPYRIKRLWQAAGIHFRPVGPGL